MVICAKIIDSRHNDSAAVNEQLMDDPELLAATVEGDAEAFAAFYRRHLSLVVAFCLRSTGDREVAADLASEVFAAALTSAPRFNPASGSAEAWLIGIAQNKLRESQRRGRVQDAIRRKLQMQPLDFSDYGLDRVEQLASQGDRTLQAVLNSLTGAERDAVQARIIEERSYDEIARTLGCSETVVRQRVSRGLSRARRRLTNPRPGEADS
jgi:RNA polymerase sigma factor (sigma-70 family)